MMTRLWFWFAYLALIALGSGCNCAAMRTYAAEGPVRYACRGGTVGDDAGLSAKAGCLRVVGDLTIVGVQNLALLDALQSVDGTLTVRATKARTLQGLEGLRSVGALSITNNPELSDVSALRGLSQARTVHFKGNRALRALQGLESLREVDQLVIERSVLITLDGLDGLRRIGRLELRDNSRLISMAGLNRVEQASEVTLDRNPLVCGKLGVLRGLLTLPTVLVTVRNTALTDKELEHLRPFWKTGSLVLR